MLHLSLHFIVPFIVTGLFYRPKWMPAFLIMIATMIVDLDHLLANPVYDPNRCSIGFHPMHTFWPIVIYALMFIAPIFLKTKTLSEKAEKWNQWVHLSGLGLLIHMVLDGLDCIF